LGKRFFFEWQRRAGAKNIQKAKESGTVQTTGPSAGLQGIPSTSGPASSVATRFEARLGKHFMADTPKRTDVNTLGEFGLIDHLTRGFGRQQASTILGVGDDAAIIDTGGSEQLVVSTDMLVEGIHFDFAYTPLKHLGYKAVAVNVSDICAMNARPQQITVSIALSNRFSVEALEELYAGVRRACEFYGVDLVGGDTTSSTRGLIISVTAIGRAPASRITRRSGAKPGDLICISGHLGGAYLGLQLLEREPRPPLSLFRPPFDSHSNRSDT
jgi:thiamin-phosphate kinase